MIKMLKRKGYDCGLMTKSWMLKNIIGARFAVNTMCCFPLLQHQMFVFFLETNFLFQYDYWCHNVIFNANSGHYYVLIWLMDMKTARIGICQIFEGATKGWGGGTGWGGWGGWARGYFMWGVWRELCRRRVLDLLRHMWKVVPWQVREDHSCQSWAHQAVQMPIMQQQES